MNDFHFCTQCLKITQKSIIWTNIKCLKFGAKSQQLWLRKKVKNVNSWGLKQVSLFSIFKLTDILKV